MVVQVSVAVIGLAIIWGLLAAWFALKDRLINDLVLAFAALVELGLLLLAVLAVVNVGDVDDSSEGLTFLAYAVSLPALPPLVTLLAIREKTRWAMVATVVAAFAVAVMTSRIAQIWNLHA